MPGLISAADFPGADELGYRKFNANALPARAEPAHDAGSITGAGLGMPAWCSSGRLTLSPGLLAFVLPLDTASLGHPLCGAAACSDASVWIALRISLLPPDLRHALRLRS